MSEYLADRIRKPLHAKGMKRLKGKVPKEPYIIGFDSEADTSTQGEPMLFQFSLPFMSEEDTLCIEVPPIKHGGLITMLNFLDTHCVDEERNYHVWVWNIAYEVTQLFHDLPKEVRAQDEFRLVFTNSIISDWQVDLLNVKRQILRFRKNTNKSDAIIVNFYDGYGFYKTSLDGAAKMLGIGEKFVMEGYNRTTFTREHLQDEQFLSYAKRDAYITRRIGEYIVNQHAVLGIGQTISAPHMAATVFKTKFLKTDMQQASPRLEQAGLFSYHGGKNGFYLDGPSDFSDIYLYDITSAYPEAMRQLPDLDKAYWGPTDYKRGIHALYKITGNYNPCKWRGMQNHDGSWTTAGFVDGIWVTSYEMDAMLDHGEFSIDSISGYQMNGKQGGALEEYVDRFFAVKRVTTGPERETAKLLLNSLYGKFFQKQPVGSIGVYNLDTRTWKTTDPTQDFDYEAGGLYHPPIASLITGYVRARIHRLEHKYDAVMTSTDGLFGFNPPDPSDLGKDLGKLTVVRGRLRIWRERVYIFDGINGERKYALHGFRNSVAELEKIPLAKGTYYYEGKQMITLKMSNTSHNHLTFEPGSFATLPFKITI